MHLFAEHDYLTTFAHCIGAETKPPIIDTLKPAKVIDSTYNYHFPPMRRRTSVYWNKNTRIEALTANAAFNDQACAAAMKEYGYLNQEGFWQDHKPLTIIKI